MATAPETDSTAPTESPTALRSLVPEDLLERSPGCPFDPAPGLAARRGRGAVQTVDLRNGARAFLVTGFDEAREVLADARFSTRVDRTLMRGRSAALGPLMPECASR